MTRLKVANLRACSDCNAEGGELLDSNTQAAKLATHDHGRQGSSREGLGTFNTPLYTDMRAPVVVQHAWRDPRASATRGLAAASLGA